MVHDLPRTWWLLAVLATALAGVSPGSAEAQLRKTCRPIENDRMICTEVAAPDAQRERSPSTAAPPAWKALVAREILDGHCAEARRIALENGDLEAAQQAVALCVSPRPSVAPSAPPRP